MKPVAGLFGLVCGTGFVVALVLTVQQARDVAPLQTRVVSTTHSGGLVSVVTEIRNTTGRALCARVEVAARDREGRDLALAQAGDPAQLAAHSGRRESMQLTVTIRDYAEKLNQVDAYVVPC